MLHDMLCNGRKQLVFSQVQQLCDTLLLPGKKNESGQMQLFSFHCGANGVPQVGMTSPLAV